MAYATIDELAAALRITVSAGNTASLQMCLDAAAEEIDHAVDRLEPMPDEDPVANRVNILRGVEWWKANDAAFGILGFDETALRDAAQLVPQTPVRADPAQAAVGGGVSAPASTGLLTMAEVRERAAAALAPVADGDPYVFDNIMGSVEPPALILTWDDPWLTYRTACMFDAQFAVMCIAGRIEVDPGIETLERLQAYVIGRLRDDDYSWPMTISSAPRRILMGGIEYLGASVIYRIRVQI